MSWFNIYRRIRTFIQVVVLQKEQVRQNYYLGVIDPKQLFKLYYKLCERGYIDNFLAYVDKGEKYNLRKFHFVMEGCFWQTHIRIFEDGEVRGHYEITPESDPRAHYSGVTMVMIKNKERIELMQAISELEA